MIARLDETHDPSLRSWVPSADDHPDFPIQNLPFGIFTPPSGGGRRGGVAIGDAVLDLAAVVELGLLGREGAEAAAATDTGTLNAFLALGPSARRALRAELSALLRAGAPERTFVAGCLHDAAACLLHLPAAIGDYTDFYAGIHHAENVGRQFRPDNPLLPNYKHLPIGYHGRASSVRPSGEPVRRPNGQRKPASETEPSFGPSRNLDLELELGIWIGPGNPQGEPVPIAAAADRIAGFCLLNDWSARDIQGWEYQPLGPFLAKSFATTISPWIVTPEAMAPFRLALPPRPAGDPAPMPYLDDPADREAGALDLALFVDLVTPGLVAQGLPPHRLAASNARHLYWSVAQMVAHHTVGGCNLRPGDLLGTGTISAPEPSGYGSLLEITNGGRQPVALASGEERRFLQDGDEIVLTARASRPGAATIGFGPCRATILPAPV